MVDLPRARAAVRELLVAIGEDPDREGLQDTPDRVARAWSELVSGRDEDLQKILRTTSGTDGFREDYDAMIVVADVPFASTCEHHLMPFHGTASVGYIPNQDGLVVGLSKIPRLVRATGRRLQVQERLTRDVALALRDATGARGVGVRVTAVHTCAQCRGVGVRAPMVTQVLLDCFRQHEVRDEFDRLVAQGARC